MDGRSEDEAARLYDTAAASSLKGGETIQQQKSGELPPHIKYPRYLTSEEERLAQLFKPTPSMLAESLSVVGPLSRLKHKAAAPEIIEFLDVLSLQSTVPLDEPLFQPHPLQMQFRDYDEFGCYSQTLFFRNNDSIPRRMRVSAPDSAYFSLKPNPRNSDRVAPGMEVSYEVTFKPHGKREYHETLIVVTEREKFVVEVSALGPWSCMDFPDEVGFGTCPVHFRNERIFLVRNMGEQSAKFIVSATAPFDVSPQCGFVELGDTIQVTVGFNADTCADHDGELEVIYDNGQKSYVHLHGSAKNIDVSIDKPIAEIDPAYISLTSTYSIKIHNNSDQRVDFEWKAFANFCEDGKERARLHRELNRLEALEYEELENRVYEIVPELEDGDAESGTGSSLSSGNDSEGSYNNDGIYDLRHEVFASSSSTKGNEPVPLAKQRDLAALRQKYKNLRHAVNDDSLLFNDENFRIEPLYGEVWSHSSLEITITFRPLIAADYSSVACLAISGRENRLPLKVLGQGIGPKAGFTFYIVDVGNVFINSRHNYELQLENRGDIECEYTLDESDSPLARQIVFSPSSGVLEVENSHIISVDFCSSTLGEFSEQFTFSMKGSNDKLKVRLKGTVIGPTFHLNINELKFDRVAYGFCNTRSFNVYNTSAIPMEYALRVDKDTKFDEPEFVLQPNRGVIPPGQHQAVTLDFTSRTIGKYKTSLIVDVIGIGTNQLGVPISAECAVANVSLVPSHTKRVGSNKVREGLGDLLANFDESQDLLDCGAEMECDKQDFCDSEGENELLPGGDTFDVKSEENLAGYGDVKLNFGRCYLRQSYSMQLALRNTMDVKAYFDVLKQDESTFCIASYEPSVEEGVVEPLSEVTLDITLSTAKLGKLNLPLYVRILGSDSPPLMIDLIAFSLGPRVVLDKPVVDFGTVECLQRATKTLAITNKSLIPALYSTFLKNAKSRFAVELYEGCLSPGETLDYPISVCPDDSMPMKDELHVFITDGETIIVPLRAKGKGTTLFCAKQEELRLCKFGSGFTSRGHERKFLVENRGKREQVLTWFNKAIVAKTAERNKIIADVERMKKDKDKEVQKKAARTHIPPEPCAVFSLHPETVALKPRTGCIFTVRAESDIPGEVLEQFTLESKVDKDKTAIKVLESTMSGNFVNPLLETSVDVIEFCYTFSPEEQAVENGNSSLRATHKQPFKLKNISQLPLDFILRTQVPFTVDTFEIALEPGEEKEVTVMFDPFVNDDPKTQTILSKLTAVHKNHPQQDSFDIRAQINFPNLDFAYDEVNFGCIVNNTTKTTKVKVTNNSIIDTMFSWAFVEEDDSGRCASASNSSCGRSAGRSPTAASLLPKLSPNEVFDIRPFRGMLRPGESQDIEVSFFGHANRKFNVCAVCEVEGGPEHELVLKGEASQVSYRLDQTSLDFGDLAHDKSEEQQFTIFNTSKVAFAFRAISSQANVILCMPSEGRIFAKDFHKITVRFSPGVPDKVAQNIMLEIAHFEPVALPVYGRGVYSSISVNLPREEELFKSLTDNVIDEMIEEDEAPKPLNPVAEEANEWMGLLAEAEENLRELQHTGEQLPVAGDNNSGAIPLGGYEASSAAQPQSAFGETVVSTSNSNKCATVSIATTLASQCESSVTASSKSRGSKRTKGPAGSAGSSIGGRTYRKGPRFDMCKVRLETEANRLRFVRFLKRVERDLAVGAISSVAIARPGSRKSNSNMATGKKKIFAVAKYVMDFGNVVMGKSKKKYFKVLNTSAMPISMDVDKAALSRSSFDIEPAKIQRLSEEETVDITVVFVAKKDAALGPTQVRVPLDIRGGPPVELVLCANVTMPEVSISREAIQFSPALVGECRVMTVQLRNSSPVPAEWSAPLNDKDAGGDFGCFNCSPSIGTLLPRERVNVEVTFTPNDERSFAARLPFHVADNPRAKVLVCKGEGMVHHIEIAKQMLELTPTLPSLSSTATQEFSIANTSDHDIEIYSVDFDDQYLFEERIVTTILDSQEADGSDHLFHGKGSVLMTNLRAAGEPFQQSIVEMYNEILAASEAARVVEKRIAEEEAAADGVLAAEVKDLDAAGTEGVGQLEQINGAETEQKQQHSSTRTALGLTHRKRGLAVDVVLHGPPLCGKTSVATDLARIIVPENPEKREAPILVIDKVMEWGAKEGLLDFDIASHCGLECPEPEDKKHKSNKRPLDAETLTALLRVRLNAADCGAGVIIKGLTSKYCDAQLAAVAVHDAFVVAPPPVAGSENENREEYAQEQPIDAGFIPNKLHVVTFGCGSKDDYNTLITRIVAENPELTERGSEEFDYDAFITDTAAVLQIFVPKAVKQDEANGTEKDTGAVADDAENKDGDTTEFKTNNEEDAKDSADDSLGEAANNLEHIEIKEEDQEPALVQCFTLDDASSKTVDQLMDILVTWMPEPGTPKPDDWDEFWIPIPGEKEYQIIKRTPRRALRKTQTMFTLETIVIKNKGNEVEDGETEAQETESTEAGLEAEVDTSTTRWVIPAHSELNLRVRFKSTDVGNFEKQLVFEVMGGQRQHWVVVKGLCTVPTISSDPRNVFMNRVKSRPLTQLLSKKFVIDSSTYDFGPLLAGRDATACAFPGKDANASVITKHANLKARHCETFRISNSGILPVDEVTFTFVSSGDSLDINDLATTPFIVEPEFLALAAGETKDISVWAFPQTVGSYASTLVCCIKDNPELVQFKVSCIGTSPEIALSGPWEDVIGIEDENADADTEAASPNERAKVLDFERLLLGRHEERVFTVRNTCKVPVQWKLDLCHFSELVEEFSIYPTHGVLLPMDSTVVTVHFTAKTPVSYDEQLAVLFADTEAPSMEEYEGAWEALGGAVQRIEVGVKAEGYDIIVQPNFLQDGDAASDDGAPEPRLLDFGIMRVFEEQTRIVKLKNAGKYTVDFRFSVRKHATRDLLTVVPQEGSLEPDQEQVFTFRFTSTTAARLRNNKDIQCVIMEPKTGKVEESFEVPVNAQSIFSAFRLQPTRGVHFGAVKFGSVQEKVFEIKNDEQFEFSYEVLSLDELEARKKALAEEEAAFIEDHHRVCAEYDEANDGAPMQATATDSFALSKQLAFAGPNSALASGAALPLGAFSVEPRSGLISPGTGQTVKVTYQAEGDVHSLERVVILISGRAIANNALLSGEPFELAGESHIPGINIDNYESIFEEQAVVRTLDGNNIDEKGVFSTEANTFSFGAVIHTSVSQSGICERFKISNPNKIKALIHLAVMPRTEASEGVFSVQPEHLELPSHEYTFVNVYFKPNAMKKYSAQFKASVVDGELKPRSSCLEFDMQGEGTLPCLTIVEPSALSDNVRFVVEHGRTQLGKNKTRKIVVRNDGIVPATVRCDFPMDECFSLVSDIRNSSVTLQPHEVLSTLVRYAPQSADTHSCEFSFRVLHNEFELSRFVCIGEGYQDNLTFENLPHGEEDTLCFGDVPLCTVATKESKEGPSNDADAAPSDKSLIPLLRGEKSVSFVIRSQCAEPMRYSWVTDELPGVSITPMVGHLPPYGMCDVTATVVSNEPVSLKDVQAKISVTKLTYSEEAFTSAKGQSIAWNDQMFSVSENGEQKTVPEPAHELLTGEGANSKLELPVSAEVDAIQYEVAEDLPKVVQFKQTMMFQSRAFKYPVKNTGRTAMKLTWAIKPASENSASSLHCPFTILPAQTIVSPGTEEVFTVRFAPMEVEHFEYEAETVIQNLGPNVNPLILRLQGMAERPLCHVELERSSYLERRKAPLDVSVVGSNETVKVLEFVSLGIHVKNTKRFYVINPTNLAYEFELTPVGSERNLKFSCVTQRGVILPGKRCELAFTFTPDDVETQEGIWQFSISEQNVTQTLLLVGTVSEPRVELSKKHINFHSILVGGQSDDTMMIVNHEHIPFSFQFDKASFQDLDNDETSGASDAKKKKKKKKPVLSVEPMSGTIGPNSSIPLSIRFAPGSEKPYNFNLDCVVHRKPNRLSLNVKGEGSAIHEYLVLDQGSSDPDEDVLGNNINSRSNVNSGERDSENAAAEMMLTPGEKSSNELNFGTVHVNDHAIKSVYIHNRGKFSFDFMWALHTEGIDESLLRMSPLRGTVPPGENVACTFEFNPRREVNLNMLKFQCTVAGARKYNVMVSGSGTKPLIAFSSLNFDFGPCFLVERGASSRSEEQVLTISNNEIDSPVSLDCLFEKSDFLDIDCEPTVLQPGESLRVPIRFTPRELCEYNCAIPFEINGLYTVKVLFAGEGTILDLGLENPAAEVIKFGSRRVGGRATKQFKIVNRSKRVASFRLVDKDDRLATHAVSFKPGGVQAVRLRPCENCVVQLSFAPEQRYPPFNEALFLEVNGVEKKLLKLTGACQAEDVKLELSALTFGDVCESCRLTRKVQIQNAGDLRAKFHWEIDRHGKKEFCIFPMDGVLLPHSQMMVDVTFHPTVVADELRAEVRLVADGNDQIVFPLSLTGTCMAMPKDGVQELRFDGVRVREVGFKTIEIENPTQNPWVLQPTIHNGYWSGNKHLEVPPNGSASYEIKFCPLTMTSDANAAAAQAKADTGKQESNEMLVEHHGSVFFALPNGTAKMYKLLGKASAPAEEGTVEEFVAAKKMLFVPLSIKNCFRTAQRMTVSIERIEGNNDHFYKGPRSLDVPGNASRDYKLNFVGYLEGKSAAKITFTNTLTGEYLFYFIKVDVTAPEEQGVLTLSTAVRQTISSVICIENPFYGTQKAVYFETAEDKPKANNVAPDVAWWTCNNPFVRVLALTEFAENREGTFEVEYRPLVVTSSGAEETVQLTLNSPQLGSYPYLLKLKALPSQSERSLYFRSTLGSSHEQVFRFTHLAGKPTDYSCKISHPLFFDVPPSVKVDPAVSWNGTELSVLVRFEPQGLGETKDVLSVSSPDGGEYTCMLYGICDPPRPSGPFTITDPAKGINIDFKNVFEQAKEFKFIVDSDEFSVNGAKSQLIKVDSGKSVSLTVKSRENKQVSRTPLTGKMLVTCMHEPDLPAWTFYVRAE